MKFFLLTFIFLYTLNAKLVILDTYEYKSKTIHELSDLAYDGKILFAISDYGVLEHFNLDIQNNKIKNIKLIKSYRLKNKYLHKLKKKKRDSEGLVYLNKNLYISFEGVARIVKYSLNGIKIKKLKIPKALRDMKNYKSKNKALEALAYSKKYGFITAPELPFGDEKVHILYTTKHKTFRFKASGMITALEFIDKNSILVLERDFDYASREWNVVISKVFLNNNKSNFCKVEQLKVLNSKKDKFVDNYEGLTKIQNHLFLMVSDDNNNLFEKTYFVLFKLE